MPPSYRPKMDYGRRRRPVRNVKPSYGKVAARPVRNITPSYGKLSGPSASSASAAPATSGYQAQAMPFDPVYENTLSGANRGYDQTIAANQYQRGRVEQSYGFTDVSDPFNRAAMLQRAFDQSQRGTTNSMASQGQLYSGALQRGLDEGRHGYDRDYSGLRKSYEDELQGLTQSDLSARLARDEAINEGLADRIGRAPAPEDPGPAAGSGGANPRIAAIRKALMSHPKNWSQRPRLMAELQRLRGG